MVLWAGLPLVMAAVLGVLRLRERSRRRATATDPAYVARDAAERPVDREAQRRAMDLKYNDPGW